MLIKKHGVVLWPSKCKDVYNVLVTVLARSVSLTAGEKIGVNVHEIATGGNGTPKGVGLPGSVHPESVILNTRHFVDT